MKMLSCKKEADMNCNFEVKADTEEEVMSAAMDHAQKFHKDKVGEMMKTMSMDEVKRMMKSKMVDV